MTIVVIDAGFAIASLAFAIVCATTSCLLRAAFCGSCRQCRGGKGGKGGGKGGGKAAAGAAARAAARAAAGAAAARAARAAARAVARLSAAANRLRPHLSLYALLRHRRPLRILPLAPSRAGNIAKPLPTRRQHS